MTSRRLGAGSGAVLFALVALVSYVLGEGVYSLARGARFHQSLAGRLIETLHAADPRAGLAPDDPNARVIYAESEFDAVLDALRRDAVGLGNSPFKELVSDAASVNFVVDGCLQQRPNLRKEMTYLRTRLFNPFDQVTAFYDADRTLSPEVRAFLDRYGFRRIAHTTNAYGERVTLPAVASPDKVLIAGDSVANGAMVDDRDTLSSQLQARDPARQYVNLGIGSAAASDVACALRRSAPRYAGQIRELIYVYCENDFAAGEPLGTPEDVVDWLTRFAAAERVGRVTVVYSPYLYNVAPQLTRLRGQKGFAFPFHAEEKRRLAAAAQLAGFAWLDVVEIAQAEAEAAGTQFAPLALYVDHAHYSPLGLRRIAERLLEAGPGGAVTH